MNPFEKCKPYIFRACGDGIALADGPSYCFEVVIDGKHTYHLAARDTDGEFLFKSPNDGLHRFMAVVGLTEEQAENANAIFGRFVGDEFERMTTPLSA